MAGRVKLFLLLLMNVIKPAFAAGYNTFLFG